MLSWMVRNRTVWSFYCVETNEWHLFELLVICSNTWEHLTVGKQMSSVFNWKICIKQKLLIVNRNIHVRSA